MQPAHLNWENRVGGCFKYKFLNPHISCIPETLSVRLQLSWSHYILPQSYSFILIPILCYTLGLTSWAVDRSWALWRACTTSLTLCLALCSWSSACALADKTPPGTRGQSKLMNRKLTKLCNYYWLMSMHLTYRWLFGQRATDGG